MPHTQIGNDGAVPTLPSGEDPEPRRPAFRRFARAVAARNSARSPGLIVAARAAIDVVLGQDSEHSQEASAETLGSTTDGSDPGAAREPEHPLPRPLRGVRIIAGAAIAVAVCAGTFGRAASGLEVAAASDAPVAAGLTPLSVLQSAARHSAAAVGAARDTLITEPLGLGSVGVRVSADPVRRPSARDSSGAARVRTDWLRRQTEALRRRPSLPPGLPFGAPVAGPVSSPFGFRRHPVLGGQRHHDGTDFAVPLWTPVHATADGRVVSAGHRSGYGLAVEVAHRDPAGLETRTLYAHLSSAVARPGQSVRRGDVVALSGGVGPSAGLSTGPHLHYELRLGAAGGAADPATLADRVQAWRAESARRAALVAHALRDARAMEARTDSVR